MSESPFDNLDRVTPYRYICENCGKVEVTTQRQAFENGWDYPPFMGAYGTVSPRNCGDCGIQDTLYWRLITNQTGEPYVATEKDQELLTRITHEPESLVPDWSPEGLEVVLKDEKSAET